MKIDHDTEYALERETQERIAADAAIDAAVREIHLTLAGRYADQADAKPRARKPAKWSGIDKGWNASR